MTPDQIIAAGGTAGTIALLLVIVQRLWAAHEREDERREARLTAAEAREDKLADGLRDSNSLLTTIRDEARGTVADERRRERGARSRTGG